MLPTAREIGCSDAYIQVRLKAVHLGLHRILEAHDPKDLLLSKDWYEYTD